MSIFLFSLFVLTSQLFEEFGCVLAGIDQMVRWCTSKFFIETQCTLIISFNKRTTN